MKLIPIPILLFLFLILKASVSSQRVQYQIPIKLNSPNTSQSYLDGCKTILQGGQNTFGDQGIYYNTFATWENQSPNQSLLRYFENHKGVISKIWRHNSNPNGWSFNLTLYDGDYVDQKFVMARFDLNDIESSMNILQSNGTFVSSQQIDVSISYGKSNVIQKEAIIKGQLTIYFLDKKYAPISDFSNANLKEDTLQIFFESDDGSFSFSTSLFSNICHIALFDVILVLGYVLAYAFFSLSSIGKAEELREKVSLLSVCMVYISSAYIGLWTIFHFKLTRNFLLFVPLLGVFIDWIKQTIFLLKKKSFSPWGIFFLLSFPPPILAALSYRFVWINLFPVLALQVPLLIKLADTRGERTYYFTRFQVCNWICVSMWMGYFYLYPSNIYLTSPQPLLIGVSFGLILVQVVISYRMEKEEREIQGRRRGRGGLLQQPNNQNRSSQRPLLPPSNNQNRSNNIRENNQIELPPDHDEMMRDYERILQLDYQLLLDAQRRNREIRSLLNESDLSVDLQSSQNRPRQPSRNAFEYTFDAQREEDEAFLTDTCAICCEFLIGDHLDKLYKTPCGHIFHGGCLRAWGQKKLECPCCRKELPQFKNSMI